MSEESEPQYREGEILSAKVDEGGVIRIESVRDGEVHHQAFDHEGFRTQDGQYHSGGQEPLLSEQLPDGPLTEGQILGARVNEQGSIEYTRVVDGEVRHGTYSEEPVQHDPPHPTEVTTTPTAELDLAVHQMAEEARGPHVEPVFEGEVPVPMVTMDEHGAYTIVERDAYGDLRSHTYDTDPIRQLVEEPRVVVHEVEPVQHLESHSEAIEVVHDADVMVVHEAMHDAEVVGHHEAAEDSAAQFHGGDTATGGE